MKRRMIDNSMWHNESFMALCFGARLLLIGIINYADDQGRTKGGPLTLKLEIFPVDNVSLEEIDKWLKQFIANGTIELYTVDGKQYIQLLNWWQYQSLSFAWASPHPRPEGWHDRLRFTRNNTTYTCNWISTKGDPLPNTCDENGKPISPNGVPPTPKDDSPHGPPHGNPHGTPSSPSNLTKLNLTEEERTAPPPTILQPSFVPEPFAADKPPPPLPPPRKKVKSDSHRMTNPIYDAWVAALPEKYSWHKGKERAGAKLLAIDGWLPEQVVACYEWLRREPWRKDQHIGLQTVLTQIGVWYAKYGDDSPADDSAEVKRIRAECRAHDAALAAAAEAERAAASEAAAASVPVPDVPRHEVADPDGQQWPRDNARRFQPAHDPVQLPVQYRPSTFVGQAYPARRPHARRPD